VSEEGVAAHAEITIKPEKINRMNP